MAKIDLETREAVRASGARSGILAYFSTAALGILIPAIVLRLWNANWHLPFGSFGTGDLLFHSGMFKGMLENGWYWTNKYLGAPGTMVIHDFPYYPNLHMVIVKFLALFVRDYGSLLNLYFILTFPLSALTALISLRSFGVSMAPAMLAGLLFSCLPFHFQRNEGHIFYTAYFMFPLLAMFAIRAWRGELAGVPGWWKSRRFLFGCLTFSLAAFDLPYYSFFAVCFTASGGLYAWMAKKQGAHFAAAALLAGVSLISFAINVSPARVYVSRNGRNPSVAARGMAESELYGLKFIQLVLPITGHRVPLAAHLRNAYNAAMPLVNENDSASLGLIGSLGLAVLLAALFFQSSADDRLPLLGTLSRINLLAVGLGIVGGLGAMIALVMPEIRAYNRISVCIGFFSLFAVALTIDWLFPARRLQWPLCGALLVLGIWEQTSPRFAPAYGAIQRNFDDTRNLVARIEAALPPGSMVLQLPHMSFPENGSLLSMGDYDPMMAYLNSASLRWSYGTVRGRSLDDQMKEITRRPVPDMVREAALIGFRGIYIDRFGYLPGRGIERELIQLLGVQPLESRSGRLAFFTLAPWVSRLQSEAPPNEFGRMRQAALHELEIQFNWRTGFFGEEEDGARHWRWCGGKGVVAIRNSSSESRRIEISMRLATLSPGASNLIVSSGGFSDHLRIGENPTLYQRILDVPSGESRLDFSSDAPAIAPAGDPRRLVFSVTDFQYREVQ